MPTSKTSSSLSETQGPCLRVIRSSDAATVSRLLDKKPARDPGVEKAVADIIARVRAEGDRAVTGYARRFDQLRGSIEVPKREIDAGARLVIPQVRRAMEMAAANIRRVSARQLPKPWTIAVGPGLRITQRVVPLDRVGCYVPGGRYPLPSSLLMTAIPAIVAGVPEVIAVCPKPDPTVLFAARLAGVTRLLRIGGAHAIAALAYGTRSVRRVDKIVGPGSAYVAAAKAQVSADCAIDFFAGPSEIAVISSEGVAGWIAADLIAQAEHDPDARAILLTPRRSLAIAVAAEVEKQVAAVPAAVPALRQNGGIIVTPTIDDAVDLAQRLAPEHLVCDTEKIAERVTRAGTVFVGRFSAQACGDYVTGSNHVLPTSGAAAARGGLSAADFVRLSTVQRLTADGLKRIGPAAVALADAEGLSGHALSVRIRLSSSRIADRAGVAGERRA